MLNIEERCKKHCGLEVCVAFQKEKEQERRLLGSHVHDLQIHGSSPAHHRQILYFSTEM
jgi:hypothetical protein